MKILVSAPAGRAKPVRPTITRNDNRQGCNELTHDQTASEWFEDEPIWFDSVHEVLTNEMALCCRREYAYARVGAPTLRNFEEPLDGDAACDHCATP